MNQELLEWKQKDPKTILEDMELNLSDFALFLAVMKNREAHEITLSIIMEKPDLHLEEIHVEEVVLNKSGKRAIRLDAWSKDTDGVQYNTEMQNDTEHDDVRKRSRYYQGLMDTPILKSGNQTKYKQLPSTVIIFITQEDIFGRDSAKYTFTEQCEEFEDLHLEDGTTKIFLNMSSKNGTPELVSLLQYMKKTTLENPEVVIQDEKMQKLDAVVREVKESEEWEAVSMSIYSIALEHGKRVGLEAGEKLGRETGEKLGWETLKIETFCKKLRKGKSLDLIADEMEIEITETYRMYEAAKPFGPEYDCDTVLNAWLRGEAKR